MRPRRQLRESLRHIRRNLQLLHLLERWRAMVPVLLSNSFDPIQLDLLYDSTVDLLLYRPTQKIPLLGPAIDVL